MIIGGARGGAAIPAATAAHVDLLQTCNVSRDPAFPQLFMHRLSITELRSFSDSSSNLLLFVPFVATVSVSNLAVAVATAVHKSLSVSIYETYSTDLQKTTDAVTLGAHVATDILVLCVSVITGCVSLRL